MFQKYIKIWILKLFTVNYADLVFHGTQEEFNFLPFYKPGFDLLHMDLHKLKSDSLQLSRSCIFLCENRQFTG